MRQWWWRARLNIISSLKRAGLALILFAAVYAPAFAVVTWLHPSVQIMPKQMTNFTDSTIFNFAWSRDGGQLVLARGAVNSDVVLMGNAAIRIASGSTNPLHPTYSHKIRLSSHRL